VRAEEGSPLALGRGDGAHCHSPPQGCRAPASRSSRVDPVPERGSKALCIAQGDTSRLQVESPLASACSQFKNGVARGQTRADTTATARTCDTDAYSRSASVAGYRHDVRIADRSSVIVLDRRRRTTAGTAPNPIVLTKSECRSRSPPAAVFRSRTWPSQTSGRGKTGDRAATHRRHGADDTEAQACHAAASGSLPSPARFGNGATAGTGRRRRAIDDQHSLCVLLQPEEDGAVVLYNHVSATAWSC